MSVLCEVRVLYWTLAGRIDVRTGRFTVLGVRRIGNKPWKQALQILRVEKKLYFLDSLKKVVYLLNTSDFKIRNMGAALAPGCLCHITS